MSRKSNICINVTDTIKTQKDISTDWLFYIENESKSLTQQGEFEVQNYLDREIFNPEMKDYLSTKNFEQFLSDVKETESLNLNLMEGCRQIYFLNGCDIGLVN